MREVLATLAGLSVLALAWVVTKYTPTGYLVAFAAGCAWVCFLYRLKHGHWPDFRF